MKYFPIFIKLDQNRVVVSGGGETAVAKLRLLLKSSTQIEVYSDTPSQVVEDWATKGLLTLNRRALTSSDVAGATLFYAADEDPKEAARTAAIARSEGVIVNVVDNLEASDFITPAIVDRDPVTIAIGTEGAAPVLARAIKAKIEEQLPPSLGMLARIGKHFRTQAAKLPQGLAQRKFWADYYFKHGPKLLNAQPEAAEAALDGLLKQHLNNAPAAGHVSFVGAGPGDPELLTLKARNELHEADVVIYDRLVSAPILELCRREALMIAVGKEGFGRSTSQEDINALLVEHARRGAQVVRLKGGDPTVFGRLDEEIDALEPVGISWHIVPGITAASASVAAIGQSLTKRGRNQTVRYLTAHDMQGFAEHDWRSLAREGEVTAVYMGKRAARFIQGRMLMHGAHPATSISIVENTSRPDQRILSTKLGQLEADLTKAQLSGPALVFLGLAPRMAQEQLQQEIAL
ncbi:siroheme synthase CysG [Lentibacter sp. XHP0401]|uniref:siroheme synthase CysG n=1 Tax=Lentibacter sp. XHP0401 TaxID=2984334 RepID=UPI0021E83309|nr:siroheme synthase CysG [Lentibacter sp. XHP0401]MCV2892752.1 siroheme synthase CysG [Lentibacter sp. XHP0401]